MDGRPRRFSEQATILGSAWRMCGIALLLTNVRFARISPLKPCQSGLTCSEMLAKPHISAYSSKQHPQFRSGPFCPLWQKRGGVQEEIVISRAETPICSAPVVGEL